MRKCAINERRRWRQLVKDCFITERTGACKEVVIGSKQARHYNDVHLGSCTAGDRLSGQRSLAPDPTLTGDRR